MRAGWEMLRRKLGKTARILPAFIDEEQNLRYPEGTLKVRFATSVNDAELASKLPEGLLIKGRNEFVPSQVSLEPDDTVQKFFPDLIAEVEETIGPGDAVWPDTLQRYRRST